MKMAIGCWFRRGNKTLADYSTLPDDITELMLLKLQCIKSIVTCMSVCKSWYVLITCSQFINTHLTTPCNRKEYFLCSYLQPHWRYSIDYYDGESLEKFCDLKFPHEGEIYIFGTCNGLICYAICDESEDGFMHIYLWNPTIRKLKILPVSVFYRQPSAYGFWFDANDDDYKVAKICCTKLEMYSLRTDSWDMIIDVGPCDPSGPYPWIINSNVVHIDGTLHWLVSREKGQNIMSLNISTGILQETLIWPRKKGWSSFILLTSKTRSPSLFVLRYESFTSWNCRGVMAYDESLNELYRIDLEECGRGTRLMGVRNNCNEVLFWKLDNNRQILVCNIEDLNFKDFSSSITRTIIRLLPFAETLVLLNDKNSISTAKNYEIKSMINKARFAISGVFHAVEKAMCISV